MARILPPRRGVTLGAVSAYGLVASCPTPLAPDAVARALTELARRTFPGAAITVDEDVDRGSLVSGQRERFAFVEVDAGGAAFSFCRFRPCPGGFEFVFNLSDCRRPADEVERGLTARLPLQIVRRERL